MYVFMSDKSVLFTVHVYVSLRRWARACMFACAHACMLQHIRHVRVCTYMHIAANKRVFIHTYRNTDLHQLRPVQTCMCHVNITMTFICTYISVCKEMYILV
jgi:hypothetical protein